MRGWVEGHHSLVPGSIYPSCDLEAPESVKVLTECLYPASEVTIYRNRSLESSPLVPRILVGPPSCDADVRAMK